MPRRPMEWRSGQPSLADVAAAAGVSAQTVSRVVNGTPVLPDTRARVEAAITQLGYRAHTAARALATNRFGSFGVLCFDLTKFGNLYIVDEAIHRAREAGFGVYLSSVPEPTHAELQAAVRGLTDQAVDGLLIVEARILDSPNLNLPADLPLVVAEGAGGIPHASVGVDHRAGAHLAVEHMLDLGHATVHHVSGLESSHPAVARREAWTEALRERGAPIVEHEAGDWSAASGYRAGLSLLSDAEGGEVTAVFAANDQMAAGVLRAASELGRRVPGDLSIVGYDDADFGAYLSPPLTTVRQDLRGVGSRCMDLLVAAVQHQVTLEPRTELTTPELIVRGSTGPP